MDWRVLQQKGTAGNHRYRVQYVHRILYLYKNCMYLVSQYSRHHGSPNSKHSYLRNISVDDDDDEFVNVPAVELHSSCHQVSLKAKEQQTFHLVNDSRTDRNLVKMFRLFYLLQVIFFVIQILLSPNSVLGSRCVGKNKDCGTRRRCCSRFVCLKFKNKFGKNVQRCKPDVEKSQPKPRPGPKQRRCFGRNALCGRKRPCCFGLTCRRRPRNGKRVQICKP